MSIRRWVFSLLFALGASFLFLQCGPASSTPSNVDPSPPVRAFEVFRAENIEGPSLPDPVKVLKEGAHPGFMLVHEYEVDLSGDEPSFRPTNDTTLAWVQHRYTDKTEAAPHAGFVDLVLMCYPESLPEHLQSKHVFPDAEGIIYLYSMPSKPIYIASPIKARNGTLLLDSLTSAHPSQAPVAERAEGENEADREAAARN